MTLQEELEKQGYDSRNIFHMAEELVDEMLRIEPVPEGLTPKEYMTMGSAATASLILCRIDKDTLKGKIQEDMDDA